MMFSFSIHTLIFSFGQAFIMWYSLFFLTEEVHITRRQERIYMICCFAVGYLLINLSRESCPLQNAPAIGLVLEVCFVLFQFVLFSRHIWRDLCALYTNSVAVTLVSVSVTAMINPDITTNFRNESFENTHVVLFAVYECISVITCFAIRRVILRIYAYHQEYEPVYKLLSLIIIGNSIVECIRRQTNNYKYFYELAVLSRFAIVVIMMVVYMYMIIHVKRKLDEATKRKLERETEQNIRNYEKYLQENQSLRAARHELNRYVEMTRQMKPYVASESMKSYLAELADKNAGFMNISLSGNIYIDTLMNQYAERLKEQEIMFETVIEPVVLEKETEYSVVEMLEELFGFMNRRIGSKEWCRFSLRTRKNKLLCQMEIGYNSDRVYRKRRLIDIFGNQLRVRQDFEQTSRTAAQRNGSLYYELNRETVQIGVMFDV